MHDINNTLNLYNKLTQDHSYQIVKDPKMTVVLMAIK